MAAQGNSPESNNDIIAYAVIILILILGIQWLYDYYRGPINQVIMLINYGLLWPIALTPGTLAEEILKKFDWNSPEAYEWRHMVGLLNASGRYYRFPMAALIIYLTVKAYKNFGVNEIFTTVYNMQTLLQNNVKSFPCMAPVAWRNLLDEPLDSGPWRVSRTPLQFAVENELILDGENKPVATALLIDPETGLANGKSPLLEQNRNKGIHLDRTKAEKIFLEQLGDPFESFDKLPDYIKGLAAAFAAFGSGDKVGGQKLLDQMSLSFREPDGDTPMELDTSGADALFYAHADNPKLIQATQIHNSYVTVWLMSLLNYARQKGSLACSQFIWLRPTDRTLFYSLNQLGGRTGWAESLGPWGHYHLEETLKMSVTVPDLDLTVDGFEYELMNTGFLDEKRKDRERGRARAE